MTAIAGRIIASVAGIVALWVAVGLVVGFSVEALFGYWLSERFRPFSNAHLLEEADEGLYSPVSDPAFLVHAVAIAVIVFGGSAYFLARGPFRSHPRRAVVASLVVIFALGGLWSYVWAEGYPVAMRWGVLFELASYTVASVAGVLIAVRRGADV